MITIVLLSLVATALFFASLPVVAFFLMLETCAERAKPERPATPRLFVAPRQLARAS